MNFNNFNWLTGEREITRGTVTIYEYQRGLLYREGKLLRVLEAGRYRLWPWNRAAIVVVDVRRQVAQVANQKLLTSDQVTVTLNLSADYEVVDVALSEHRVTSAQTQLYEDVQLAARARVGEVTVDALLAERADINARLLADVRASAATYGLDVLQVSIKDVILAPRVRDLLMKEVEARRLAQATLIGAREEVAALRALANAARLAQENPALLRLRELDVARGFSSNGGNTLVMGVQNTNVPLKAGTNGADGVRSEDASDEEG